MTTIKENLKKPFVKKFSDNDLYYVYDVNTNQIIEVEKGVYDIVEQFEENNEAQLETIFRDIHTPSAIRRYYTEIKNARTEHKLFSNFRPVKSTLGIRSIDEVKAIHEHGIKQLVLELTKKCNLKCAYCSTSG